MVGTVSSLGDFRKPDWKQVVEFMAPAKTVKTPAVNSSTIHGRTSQVHVDRQIQNSFSSGKILFGEKAIFQFLSEAVIFEMSFQASICW